MRSGIRDFGSQLRRVFTWREALSHSLFVGHAFAWLDRFFVDCYILCMLSLSLCPRVRYLFSFFLGGPCLARCRAQQQRDLGDLLLSFLHRYSLASKERVSQTTVLRIKGLTVRGGTGSMRPSVSYQELARPAVHRCLFVVEVMACG